MLCLVLFPTAHADPHALCATPLDLLNTFLLKFFSHHLILNSLSSPECAYCLLLINITLDPGAVFVCYTHNLSLKLARKFAWRAGCRCSELFIADVNQCRCQMPLHCDSHKAPSAFPLRCPGVREVRKGDRQPLGRFDREEKLKIPPGSIPAVHFMCMSKDRRGEASKAA